MPRLETYERLGKQPHATEANRIIHFFKIMLVARCRSASKSPFFEQNTLKMTQKSIPARENASAPKDANPFSILVSFISRKTWRFLRNRMYIPFKNRITCRPWDPIRTKARHPPGYPNDSPALAATLLTRWHNIKRGRPAGKRNAASKGGVMPYSPFDIRRSADSSAVARLGRLGNQRCSTRSRISSVRPWFQNCVPM